MPAKDPNEYMRKYRAKKAQAPEVPNIPRDLTVTDIAPNFLDRSANPIRRERVPKTWRNKYDDGLPDWPEIISNLTQHQRDELLDKMNKKPK